jgi:hypothetical protein
MAGREGGSREWRERVEGTSAVSDNVCMVCDVPPILRQGVPVSRKYGAGVVREKCRSGAVWRRAGSRCSDRF